jgi:hypothetical protein
MTAPFPFSSSAAATIKFETIQSVSRAFTEARNAFVPHTEYDAWGIEYRKTPAAEVRAEVERKAKARKAIDKRIACERKVVRRTVRTLLAAGYAITVDNGEDTPIRRSTSVNAIMAEVQACDEELLHVLRQDDAGVWKRFGTICLVYGNSGPEVISDYSTSLEAVLEPVMTYCEKLDLA